MTPRPLLLAHLAHARAAIADGANVGDALGRACAGHLDAATASREALARLRREAKERGLRDPVATIDAILTEALADPDAQTAARVRAGLPMACGACGKKVGDACSVCPGGRCWWPQKDQPAEGNRRVEGGTTPALSLTNIDATGKPGLPRCHE